MREIIIILAGMGIFYLLMVFLAVKMKERKNKQFCPICATVSLTWLSLLLLRELNVFTVNPVFLAILMGGSVCGVMYLVEKKIESAGKKLFWKITSTLLGVLLMFNVVNRRYNFYTVVVLALYLGMIFFSLKKKKENRENRSEEETKIGKETWLKKLENCC